MKNEIIILSDLWGKKDSDWMDLFESIFSDRYNIKFYDSCELGNIDTSHNDEKTIHQQFMDFGIRNAVSQLIERQKEPKIYIGCSIGGVIAWKAGLSGLKIQRLISISSTRLRKEDEKPICPIQMYFGESDPFKPSSEWLEAMNCKYKIIEKSGHGIYKDKSVIREILEQLNQ